MEVTKIQIDKEAISKEEREAIEMYPCPSNILVEIIKIQIRQYHTNKLNAETQLHATATRAKISETLMVRTKR